MNFCTKLNFIKKNKIIILNILETNTTYKGTKKFILEIRQVGFNVASLML